MGCLMGGCERNPPHAIQQTTNQHAMESETAWTPLPLPLPLAFAERTLQELEQDRYMTLGMSPKRAGIQKGDITPVLSGIAAEKF